MLNIYNTNFETGVFEEVSEFKKGCWINLVNPTEDEIKKVCDNTSVLEDFIRYPLDYEEQARIDIEDDNILFVIDVPTMEKNGQDMYYTTMPLGLIVVRDDFFITVSLQKTKIIEDIKKQRVKGLFTYKKTRLILQILFLNASNYLDILKKLNKKAEKIIASLQSYMKNKELIQLSNIENSLIYITTSLKANEIVMEKTLRGKIIKIYEDDEDILEDAIIENKQAIEMSKVYSDILSGTMDTYASIISNNLNDVMKLLASITILISVPTLIASIWGMNVNLPFMGTAYGFYGVLGIAVAISIVAFIWLKKKDML